MNVGIIAALRQAAESVLESYGFGQNRMGEVAVCRAVYVREDALRISIGFDG